MKPFTFSRGQRNRAIFTTLVFTGNTLLITRVLSSPLPLNNCVFGECTQRKNILREWGVLGTRVTVQAVAKAEILRFFTFQHFVPRQSCADGFGEENPRVCVLEYLFHKGSRDATPRAGVVTFTIPPF